MMWKWCSHFCPLQGSSNGQLWDQSHEFACCSLSFRGLFTQRSFCGPDHLSIWFPAQCFLNAKETMLHPASSIHKPSKVLVCKNWNKVTDDLVWLPLSKLMVWFNSTVWWYGEMEANERGLSLSKGQKLLNRSLSVLLGWMVIVDLAYFSLLLSTMRHKALTRSHADAHPMILNFPELRTK